MRARRRKRRDGKHPDHKRGGGGAADRRHVAELHLCADRGTDGGARLSWHARLRARGRSEEHTSELQSLMRISYAVFCLKKKKDTEEMHTQSKKTVKPAKQEQSNTQAQQHNSNSRKD